MFQSFRILLVDDDDSLRECLTEFLAGNGWDVAAAPDGDMAMALHRGHRFDFTILDYHLPDGTGLELYQKLTARRTLPAILMSGLASKEEVLAARDAGFFRFLRKPLELRALRAAVQQLIGTHFGGPLSLPARLPPSSPHRRRPRPGF